MTASNGHASGVGFQRPGETFRNFAAMRRMCLGGAGRLKRTGGGWVKSSVSHCRTGSDWVLHSHAQGVMGPGDADFTGVIIDGSPEKAGVEVQFRPWPPYFQ